MICISENTSIALEGLVIYTYVKYLKVDFFSLFLFMCFCFVLCGVFCWYMNELMCIHEL